MRDTFLEFRKNRSLPALAADATVAYWVLMALCDARISVFPVFFTLHREVFGVFANCFPCVFSSCERGFLGFLVLFV